MILTLLFIFMLTFACVIGPVQDPLFSVAANYANEGLLRESIGVYYRILSKKPNSKIAQRNLGILLFNIGKHKKSIKFLKKSIKSFKNDFDSHFFLAENYRAKKMHGDAIYFYRKSLEIRPKNPRVLKLLSWSYYEIKYYKKAFKIIKLLYSLNKKDPQIPIILCRILLKTKRLKLAKKVINRALKKLSVEDLLVRPFYLSIKGEIELILGKPIFAEKYFREALNIEPFMASALLGLGKIYQKFGKKKKAITYLNRALRVRPQTIEAHALLGELFEKKDVRKSVYHWLSYYRLAKDNPEYLHRIESVRKQIALLKTKK